MEEVKGDKYRDHMYGEGEANTVWKHGAPPNYDVVNKLFEEERTHVWEKGTLEERVQRLLKTYEMEIVHKARSQDYKTIDPDGFTFSVNGRAPLNFKQMAEIGGSYNLFLQTSLPDNLKIYDSNKETEQSSHAKFTTAFPRGFAIEILHVYSGPPNIVYKFRHWAYMEGPFKGHAPTGKKVEFYGMAHFEVDDKWKIKKVEFFFDRGELLSGLVEGPLLEGSKTETGFTSMSCPVMKQI
ncbi:Pathogen-related protein [Rhynchospora pubera]|uniref:Pathogen-related protein n=1 Tax=Rhynchospora pubera TaxID=906938 RepID=A0AAV8FU48_9POAL|nr:Pathogen-related protein [Rhynchospora pubera]KAJ4766387.1 Pathogen-related protein [Rhynchospora pubera]KAJ4795279.1 Pathogen-related protein [Rhynchospora pubera]KAJ4819112.1 Pathogen-related protein [Rhynchospora pubera]